MIRARAITNKARQAQARLGRITRKLSINEATDEKFNAKFGVPSVEFRRTKIARQFEESDFQVFLDNFTGEGSTVEAIACTGFDPTTFYRWLRKHPEKVEEIKAGLEPVLVNRIVDHSLFDWKAAAWTLERYKPEKYALQNPDRSNGSTTNILNVAVMTEDQAMRLIENQQKAKAMLEAMPELQVSDVNLVAQ